MEENISEGLTVFQFPEEYRKKIRTNNPLERVNKEIKRKHSKIPPILIKIKRLNRF
jgi:transposase-like protein